MSEFYLTRDAGNRSTDKRAKYHGVRLLDDARGETNRLVTACSGLAVADCTPLAAQDVPVGRRCGAPGCRQQYAKAVSS